MQEKCQFIQDNAYQIQFYFKLIQRIKQKSALRVLSTCSISEYNDNGTCRSCHILCQTCNAGTENDCLSCDSSKQLVQIGSNLPPFSCRCQDQYFLNGDNCQRCENSCLTCDGGTSLSCTSCKPSQFRVLQGKQCICQIGYYDLYDGDICQQCDPTCSDCYQSPGQFNQICTSCIDKREVQNDKCVCKQSFYEDTQMSCQSCIDNCLKCSSNDPLSCDQCSDNRIFQGSACKCPIGYYDKTNSQCIKCIDYCDNCEISQNDGCDICQLNRIYQDKQCICKPGYYEDNLTKQCNQCHFSCQTCNGDQEQDCSQCGPNRTKINNKCLCDDGYYENQNQQQCSKCYSACKTCSGSSSADCTSCDPTYFREPNIQNTNFQCICQSSYFEDSNLKCQQCSLYCLNCIGPQETDCTSCRTSDFRIPSFDNSKSFTCLCINGYYNDGIDPFCKNCHYSCQTCTQGTSLDCIDCKQNRSKVLNICQCNSGFFEDTILKQCSQCHPTCETCIGPSENDCTSCSFSKFRTSDNTSSPFKCICQLGYYEDSIQNICIKCHSTCNTCTGPNSFNCLSCDVSQFRIPDNNTQEFSCLCQSTYYEDSNLECQKCSIFCQDCIGPSSSDCLSCVVSDQRIPQSVQYPFSCICADKYYSDGINSLCQNCNYQCNTCIGPNSTDCTSCITSDLRIPNQTTSPFSCICIDQYFNDGVNSLCKLCHYSCQTCLEDSTFDSCTSCNSTFERTINIQNSKGQCQCNQQFYDDGSNEQCIPCSKTCLECNAQSSPLCTKCDSSKNFKPSNSSSQFSCICIPHTFYDDSVVRCVNCHPYCNSCTGIYQNNCLSCFEQQNRTLIGNKCVCKIGYFEDTKGQCLPCHSSCLNCIGPTQFQCTQCDPFQMRFYNVRYSTCQCNSGYYDTLFPFQVGISTSQTCFQCNSLCLECKSSNYCLTCINNLVIQHNTNNQCICTSGQYLNKSDSYCYNCHYTCQECVGPNKEDCLSCKKNMISTPSYSIIDQSFFQMYTCTCQGNLDKNCIKCHHSCSPYSCDPNKPNICYQCKPNRILTTQILNGDIQKICKCIDGYFENEQILECEECHPSCASCYGPSKDQCITCQSILFKFIQLTDWPIQGQCICQDGYYRDQLSQNCLLCSKFCQECLGTSTFCTKCNERQILTTMGQCICPTRSYSSKINGACQACHYSCNECDGETEQDCLSCSSSTRLFTSANNLLQQLNGSCSCYEGYFDNGDKTCQKCNSNCLTCVTKADYCLECYPEVTTHRILVDNKCVCKKQYYENEIGICIACPYDCLTCDNNKNCLKCISDDRYLDPETNRCICKQGLFESQNKQCMQCSYKCKNCEISPERCTECFERAKLNFNQMCECEDGYYSKPPSQTDIANQEYKMCKKCLYRCVTCKNSQTCTSCKPPSEHIFLNQKTKLCECYFGYDMVINNSGKSFSCIKQKETFLEIQSSFETQFSSIINVLFTNLIFVLQIVFIIQLITGQYIVSDFGIQMIFDIQTLLYFEGQKPRQIIEFLEILHYNSIFSWLRYLNPMKSIFSYDRYINQLFQQYNLSSNIYYSAGGHIFIWSITQIVQLILRKTIFHDRFIFLDQIYKLAKGRIFLSRIYNLFIKRIYFGISNFLIYQIIFALIIAKEDQDFKYYLSAYIILSFFICYLLYLTKNAKTYFQDPYKILDYHKACIIQYQISLLQLILSSITFQFLIQFQDLYYLIWTILLKFLLYFPLNIIKFKAQKPYLYAIIMLQLIYLVAILMLLIMISNTKVSNLEIQQKVQLLNYCQAFKVIICLLIAIIQIIFILDSFRNIYICFTKKTNYEKIIVCATQQLNIVTGRQNSTVINNFYRKQNKILLCTSSYLNKIQIFKQSSKQGLQSKPYQQVNLKKEIANDSINENLTN